MIYSTYLPGRSLLPCSHAGIQPRCRRAAPAASGGCTALAGSSSGSPAGGACSGGRNRPSHQSWGNRHEWFVTRDYKNHHDLNVSNQIFIDIRWQIFKFSCNGIKVYYIGWKSYCAQDFQGILVNYIYRIIIAK